MKTYINEILNTMYFTLANLIYNLIRFFSQFKFNSYKCFQKSYEEIPLIKSSFDKFNEYKYIINNSLTNYKIEKPGNWCCIYTMKNDNISENIITLNDNEITNEELINKFLEMFKNTTNLNENNLLIFKTETNRICKIYDKEFTNINLNPQKCINNLLSIEYTHPEMDKKIDIKLDNSYFYINNEILSDVFILKYLQYQENEYVFNKYYQVNIMDNKLNLITLTNEDFIVLEKSGYSIKKINKNI